MNTQEHERLAVLEKTVGELSRDVKALVDAWKAATGLVKFIKLLATIAAAFAGAYAMFHSKPGG